LHELGEDPLSLLERADRALLEAKRRRLLGLNADDLARLYGESTTVIGQNE